MSILTVRYYGPTNHKGSRIRVYDELAGKAHFYSYDYSANDPHYAAVKEFISGFKTAQVERIGALHNGDHVYKLTHGYPYEYQPA